MVVTPRAESAHALAMGLAALRVRTRLGPERNVTPLAALPGVLSQSCFFESLAVCKSLNF